ncbi:MAG: sulfatase-like hydrolase/transferase [Pirellulales bacterium]|nr:sulfatase-like hydrolase/transferase [Pirellulales bacterium]
MQVAILGVALLESTTSAGQDIGDTSKQAARKPNVVIILTDDQGYSDVGCFGAQGFTTPHLDRMADEGARFTDFYAAPTCSPSRASLLTGCYAQRVGVGLPLNGPYVGLNPNENTLAEVLKKAGYATACIGKWHLGLPDEFGPVAQGFDYFSGIPLSHIRRGKNEHTDGPRAYYRRQWKTMTADGRCEVEYDPDDTQFTQRCTREALAFIKKNRDRPFFLFLSHPQVHKEVLASKAFQGRTERGRYGDACEELDWSVGQVLATLKKYGLDEKTLVIYASDNGPWLKQGDQSGTARPLRGGKFTTWEGGVRVPCIMRWPGHIPPKTVCREVASVMDLLPTIARLADAPVPTDRVLDGKDLGPLMSGKKDARSPHEAYFYYDRGQLEGVRSGRWKLHLPRGRGDRWLLYDLKTDIGERTDVASKHPEVVAKLKNYLEQARADLGDSRTRRIGKNVRPLGVARPVLTPLPAEVAGLTSPSVSLSGTWRFSPTPGKDFQQAEFEDKAWAEIRVPGEWVMQGFTVAPDTDAGYRREFTVPADWTGQRVKIRFDAVYSDAVVWVNGHKAGRHDGGFTAWEVDVTDFVRPGADNVLALAVRNESIADVLSSGSQYAAHQLGGITRKVTLFAMPPVNVRSLHVATTFDRQFRDATMKVSVKTANQAEKVVDDLVLRVTLTGPDGAPVAIAQSEFDLPKIKPGQSTQRTVSIPVSAPAKWDCEHPNLYTLQAELLVDDSTSETIVRRFGFRQVEVRGNQLLVNGRPVKLRGVCRHEAHPLLGRSLTPELWRKDAELFRAANVNYIRTSHYPPAEEFLDACDELGLFVEEEAPICWVGHPANPTTDAWNFSRSEYIAGVVRPVLEMIERDRSRPSVILWSLANESAWRTHFVTSKRHAEAADPTRPLVFHDQCWGEANNYGSDALVANYHYPGLKRLRQGANPSRPTLLGEYAHVCTYDRQEIVTDPGVRDFWAEGFQRMWEEIVANRGTCGGAIWSGIDDVFHLPSGKSVGYGEWGLIDGWRRSKPEYWHVKKVYSPVKILDRALAVPAPGEPLRMKVANRHDFTNLSELKIQWTLGDESGVVAADVPQGGSGILEIRPKAIDLNGKQLAIKITSPRGFVIDEYRLSIGKTEKPKAPRLAVKGSLNVAQTTQEIVVSGGDWRWAFDRKTGMIRRAEIAGQTVCEGGPELMLLPRKSSRTITEHSADIAPLNHSCSGWKASVVKVDTAKDKNSATIHVAGAYQEAKGKFTFEIDARGNLTVVYRFTYLKKVEPRQTGVVFALPRAFDTLDWRRDAQWTVYPEDHLGRPAGRARAFGPAGAKNRPARVEPRWPWAQDANALGTNDFRATRHHILSASLSNPAGYALRITSDGAQSTRAWVDGQKIRLLVAGFSTAGGSWYSDLPGPPRKKLRPGSVVEDRVLVELWKPGK